MEEYIQSQFEAKQTPEWEIERGEQSNKKTTTTRNLHLPEDIFLKVPCLKRKVFVVNLILKFNFHICMHYTITSCVIFPFFPFPIFASAFHFHLFASDEWVEKGRTDACKQQTNEFSRCGLCAVRLLMFFIFFVPSTSGLPSIRCTLRKVQSFTESHQVKSTNQMWFEGMRRRRQKYLSLKKWAGSTQIDGWEMTREKKTLTRLVWTVWMKNFTTISFCAMASGPVYEIRYSLFVTLWMRRRCEPNNRQQKKRREQRKKRSVHDIGSKLPGNHCICSLCKHSRKSATKKCEHSIRQKSERTWWLHEWTWRDS